MSARKPLDPDASPVRVNLDALVEQSGLSVNAWTAKHGLVQTTVARIINGKLDPTTAQLEKIAERIGLQAWQLLAPNFGGGLHQLVVSSTGQTQLAPVASPNLPTNARDAKPQLSARAKLSPAAVRMGEAYDKLPPEKAEKGRKLWDFLVAFEGELPQQVLDAADAHASTERGPARGTTRRVKLPTPSPSKAR